MKIESSLLVSIILCFLNYQNTHKHDKSNAERCTKRLNARISWFGARTRLMFIFDVERNVNNNILIWYFRVLPKRSQIISRYCWPYDHKLSQSQNLQTYKKYLRSVIHIIMPGKKSQFTPNDTTYWSVLQSIREQLKYILVKPPLVATQLFYEFSLSNAEK